MKFFKVLNFLYFCVVKSLTLKSWRQTSVEFAKIKFNLNFFLTYTYFFHRKETFIMTANYTIEILLLFVWVAVAKKFAVNPESTIECHRREFTFRAMQTDENGKQCWDLVTAMSCWGRCDSGEVRLIFSTSNYYKC